jgi:hypothetical protein
MEFWDVDGVHLTFAWSGGKDFGEAEGRFEIMLKATLEYILPHVVERVESTIAQGRFVQIGPCTLTTEGVSFERQRWFRRTQVTVPWSRLRSELTSGVMLIADRTTPSNEIMFPFMATRNSPVLHLLAQRKEGV